MPGHYGENENEPFSLQDYNRLRRDMWFGNGKPGVTTRLEGLEGDVKQLQEDLKEFKDGQKWLIRLVLGAIILAVLNLAVHVATIK